MENKSSNSSQVLWLVISSFSSFAIAFISSAILSRYFDKYEYGTYKQLMYVYTTLQTVFTVGLASVFSYFIPKYNINEGKFLVQRVNMLLLTLGVLFGLTLYFSADTIAEILNNDKLSDGIKLMAILPIFTLPTLGIDGLYTALRKTKDVLIYNSISKIVLLLCILFPVFFYEANYKTVIIGWGVGSFFGFLLAMYMKTRPYNNVKKQKISKFYSKIFTYSIPLMGSSLVGFVIASSNQFFISRYYGVVSFAEYSNGFIALPFVAMLVGPIKSVLLPIFSNSNVSNNFVDEIKIYNASVNNTVLLLCPLLIFCFTFSNDIIVLIYGSQYESSSKYFKLSLIRDFFDLFPFLAILLAVGKTKIYFKAHLVFMIFLVSLSYFLSEQLSISALFIVIIFVLLEICMKFYFLLYIQRVEKINIMNKSQIKNIMKILFHVLFIAFTINILISYFTIIFPSIFIKLSSVFIIFYLLLLGTQKLINVNYLFPIKKILKR